jgi:hypothetical protein
VERPVQDWGVQVTAAQQGDLTAFTAVIRRFEDMAVGYAYALWSLAPRLQTAHHPDCWRGWGLGRQARAIRCETLRSL